MAKSFIGSGRNIRIGYQYLFEGKADPKQPNPYSKEFVDKLDLSEEEDLAKFHLQYASLWFAAKMGDELSGHKYNELDLDRFYGPLMDKADPTMISKLASIDSTEDVRDASDYFAKFFSEEACEKLNPDKGKGKSGEGEGKSAKGLSDEEIDAVMKDIDSLEDQLRNAIAKKVEDLTTNSKEGIYWTDRFDTKYSKHDILESCHSRTGTENLAAFEEQTKLVTNYLTKDLRRLLEERRRRYYIGGYKSGKVNAKALFSVRCGNDRIFKKKNEVRDVNSAVSLLIDLSGSMSNEKVFVAMQSAYAFAQVLTQLKVPYEVYGFSTENIDAKMSTAYREWAADKKPLTLQKVVNTVSPENLWAFKEFDEAFDYASKKSMLIAANSGVGMCQNEDSKHLHLALQRLSVRPESVKALFVFSDGEPAFGGGNRDVSMKQLKYLAKTAKEKHGVDIYSIGIKSTSVEHFYKQYKIVNKLSELPKALFEFLRKVF
jgi:cobalamin biosynthesis protein CobT